jgi:hypothetical protein
MSEGSTATSERRAFQGKELAWWCASFLGFPIGGTIARAVVGPIDETWVAFAAGAIAGIAIGAAQWLVLRMIGIDARWIVLTAAGLGVGLGIGVVLLDYGTSVGDLAMLGAFSGLGVGAAQWVQLRQHIKASLIWIPAMAVLWAAGWAVTTSIGVDVDLRWAVFGASGAITVTVLSGGLLWLLSRGGVTEASG